MSKLIKVDSDNLSIIFFFILYIHNFEDFLTLLPNKDLLVFGWLINYHITNE